MASSLVARIHHADLFKWRLFSPGTTVCLLLLVDVGHPGVDGINVLSFLYVMVCFLHNEDVFWSFQVILVFQWV